MTSFAHKQKRKTKNEKAVDQAYVDTADAIVKASIYIFKNHLGRLRNKKKCAERYLDMLTKVINGEPIV